MLARLISQKARSALAAATGLAAAAAANRGSRTQALSQTTGAGSITWRCEVGERRAWLAASPAANHARLSRFNWNLHSVMGFWSVAFLFMWAVTGAYLVFQEALSPVIDAVFPYNEHFDPRPIDTVIRWIGRLHFGRYGGLPMKTAWAVLGLAPAALFVTGAIMWWQRVVRPRNN